LIEHGATALAAVGEDGVVLGSIDLPAIQEASAPFEQGASG
jgi:hypothetical protein